ncbi:putative protein kinase AGC-RSK-2 family [Helianthus annuus]|nr:putative protein kinase AGC-RSK-2 family [Helianthus annuus]
MEPPWLDDLADDLQSISFNSTTTTTTDINRSTSSESEATWTTSTTTSTTTTKPHTPSNNPCWTAIRASNTPLTLTDIHFISRLGSGDIGSVYLAKLKHSSASGSAAVFAAKVMNKKEIASRNKEARANTEKEILQVLNHPFCPTLYASLDSPKWSCMLTEFCPGGDLHVLRQRQPCKRFPESAVRYAR